MRYILNHHTVSPQKIQIRTDHLNTLNSFQKLVRDINWLRPKLGIPNYALTNLFNTLKGDADLNSPRTLTAEANRELQEINQGIQEKQLSRINIQQPLTALIMPTPHSPTGIIWQNEFIIRMGIFTL